MEQFKIPVDVQVEDKIVGPLTLRHLIIVGIGGGISYFLYLTLAQRYYWPVWLPPVLIVTTLTIAFAFIKIHDMSFFKFLIATIEYNAIPKQRVWNKNDSQISNIKLIEPKKKDDKQFKKAPQKELDQIIQLIDNPK